MNAAEYAKSHKWNMPTICPVCGTALEINESGVLFCPNPTCEQKVLHKIQKLTNIWNVLEIGPAIIKDFVEAENITSNYEFLTKLKNPSLDNVCGKNAEKIRRNFAKRMAEPFKTADFLASFDLDGYGRRSIQSLVDAGFDLQKLVNGLNIIPEIANVYGWTENSAKELVGLIAENKEDIEKCYKLISIEDKAKVVEGGKFSGLSFCFTGSNDFKPEEKRKLLEEKVSELGGTVESVKKGLSYLVSSETGTAKMVKAEKLEIATITYEEFYKMMEA